MREFLTFLILCMGLVIGSHAWAQSVHCSYGYQDSSCGGTFAAAAQTPPQCSMAAGWTTISAAVWQGSRFSSPQCNYQAPPSCPAGYSTVSSASWNGSSWVGLACAIPPPPGSGSCQYGFASGPTWTGSSWTYTCNAPPPTGNRSAICSAALASISRSWASPSGQFNSFSPLNPDGSVPPETGGGYQMQNYGGNIHYSGATDGIWSHDANNPGGAGGNTGSGGIGFCIFQAGTSNLLFWEYDIVSGYDGG